MIAREMPILAMLEEIHHQLMGWFADRRQLEKDTSGAIISGVAAQIQKLINERARRYRYIKSTEEFYEIKSKETLKEYIVNLARKLAAVVSGKSRYLHHHTHNLIAGIPLWSCTCSDY